MNINKVKEYLAADWDAVIGHINAELESDISLLNVTNRSILANSGKQLRPLLALLMARVCSGGEVVESTLRYAASVELLHNATLLHDDVADCSDTRRGVPTVMSLMGPSVSVLIGDFWLVKSLALILRECATDTRAMKIISGTLCNLAEGEMLQLQKAQKGDTDESDYLKIIYDKTGSLFEAACYSAAISVSASETFVKAARDYAVSLGLAFQIKDDILDYAGSESLGKPLGVDVLEQKITMPLLGAMKKAGPEQEKKIRAMVSEIPDHPEYRDEVVRFVKENGGLEYAEDKLDQYVAAAVSALSVFPDCYEKTCLAELAYFTAQRNM